MSEIVNAARAAALLEEGYVYLDVRSQPEFFAGHAVGAYNIPISDVGPSGMAPNPDFLEVCAKHFSKESKLVVACKMGGRSRRAVGALEAAGYTNVVDFSAGWDGKRDNFGAITEKGWRQSKLPTQTDATEGRSYPELKA